MNYLERQVLALIGEDPDNPDVFTDDDLGIEQIRTSLSEGVQEVLTWTGGYVETFRLPLVGDQTFYKLAFQRSELAWFVDVWHVETKTRLDQTSLVSLDAWDPRWMRYTGTPTQYVPIGTDTIGICPKSSGSNGLIEIHFVSIPFKYEHEDDRILLKKTYERAVVNYAVAEYFASRGDAREATLNLQLFSEIIGIADKDNGDRGHLHQMDTSKIAPDNFRLSTGNQQR